MKNESKLFILSFASIQGRELLLLTAISAPPLSFSCLCSLCRFLSAEQPTSRLSQPGGRRRVENRTNRLLFGRGSRIGKTLTRSEKFFRSFHPNDLVLFSVSSLPSKACFLTFQRSANLVHNSRFPNRRTVLHKRFHHFAKAVQERLGGSSLRRHARPLKPYRQQS